MNAVTFELSLSIEVHDRKVYSMLDILSDLGGLYGALRIIFFFTVTFFQYRGSHMFILRDMLYSKDQSFRREDEE